MTNHLRTLETQNMVFLLVTAVFLNHLNQNYAVRKSPLSETRKYKFMYSIILNPSTEILKSFLDERKETQSETAKNIPFVLLKNFLLLIGVLLIQILLDDIYIMRSMTGTISGTRC